MFLGGARRLAKVLVVIVTLLAVFAPRVEAAFDFSMSVVPDVAGIPPGWSTSAIVNVTLVDTPVRTVSLTATKTPNELSITVTFTPASGDPTFGSNMVVTTTSATPEGKYNITVTGTSQNLVKEVKFTLTVLPAFSVTVSPALGATLPGGSLTPKVTVDAHRENVIYNYQVKYVDSDNSEAWEIGEIVVLDTSENALYDLGETVISGTTPSTGSFLSIDPKHGFVDANIDNSWSAGETTVYDSNGDGNYDTGEPVLVGTAPAVDTSLKHSDIIVGTIPGAAVALEDDPRVKYADTVNNNIRDTGETVVYDSNDNSIYDTGEPVIVETAPNSGTSLEDDPKINYLDSNNNNIWVPELVTLSCPGAPAGISCSFDPASQVPKFGSNLTITTPGSIVPGVYNVTVRGTGSTSGLVKETKFTVLVPAVFINPSVSVGDTGTQVTISVEVKGFPSFTSFEVILSYAHDSLGGPLDAVEIMVPATDADVWPQGAVVFTVAQSVDSKVKYLDSNNNNVWNSGETVAYDNNGNGKFDTNEPVILGTAPATGTVLDDDPKLRYVDSNSNKVLNLDYVIAPPDPVPGVGLKDDPKVKYVDSNNNFVRNTGEPVIYDSDSDSRYDVGEPVIAGSTPSDQTILRDDSRVRYFDANSNNFWDSGEGVVYDANANSFYEPAETMVYDSNGNSAYDSGETVIAGTAPPLSTALENDRPVGEVRFSQGSGLATQPGVSGVLFSVKFNVTQTGTSNLAFSVADFLITAQTIPHVTTGARFCKLQGDVNNDGAVNFLDLGRIGASFLKATGDPGFDPEADVNNDGAVNFLDLGIVGAAFLSSC